MDGMLAAHGQLGGASAPAVRFWDTDSLRQEFRRQLGEASASALSTRPVNSYSTLELRSYPLLSP